jgi:hypothetical protein
MKLSSVGSLDQAVTYWTTGKKEVLLTAYTERPDGLQITAFAVADKSKDRLPKPRKEKCKSRSSAALTWRSAAHAPIDGPARLAPHPQRTSTSATCPTARTA